MGNFAEKKTLFPCFLHKTFVPAMINDRGQAVLGAATLGKMEKLLCFSKKEFINKR
jgi:hypothetical protein